MRKGSRRRPEVEPLESMTLLSGMAGMPHHATAALVARPRLRPRPLPPALPNPLHLAGSARGNFRVNFTSETSTFSGNGFVSPLGQMKFSGSAGLHGGSAILSGKPGKLVVTLNGSPGLSGFSGTYTIVGGTKALTGETGSGSLQVSYNAISPRGGFAATFH